MAHVSGMPLISEAWREQLEQRIRAGVDGTGRVVTHVVGTSTDASVDGSAKSVQAVNAVVSGPLSKTDIETAASLAKLVVRNSTEDSVQSTASSVKEGAHQSIGGSVSVVNAVSSVLRSSASTN
ncbi:MAG: hypothetical protein KGR16_00615 [Verrucomicrobia bacterium]|nr:hypothetical protein [Verrucomicrobiota bacterium]MDE3047725.1 hypothetical protein [Verrucomicrobiota bacterium]